MAKTLKLKGGEVSSIKKLKASLKKSSGGSQYMTRVPENGSLTVRFLTEPDGIDGQNAWVETWMHYDENREPRNFPCVEDCEYEADGGDKPRKCYLANVLDVDEGKVVPLQMPITLANVVLKKYEKFKTLLDRDYELTREGTGFDTEYDATPETPRKMKLDRYNLIDLNEMLLNMLNGESTDEDDDDDDEDEKPRKKSSKGGLSKKKPIKRKARDEDEDDDEEDDEEDEKPRRLKKSAPKKITKKKKPLKRR